MTRYRALTLMACVVGFFPASASVALAQEQPNRVEVWDLQLGSVGDPMCPWLSSIVAPFPPSPSPKTGLRRHAAGDPHPRGGGQTLGTPSRGAASACVSGRRSLERGEAFAGAAGERDDLLALVAGECFLKGRRCGPMMPGRGKDLSEIVERVTLHVQRVRRF